MEPRDAEEPKTYAAQDVSQGVTVLRSPWRKIVFFGGLIAAVVLAVVFGTPHML